MRPTSRAQRGVGLVEILIAVVIVSVGFLAAARMQVQAMRFSQSAYFQSQAYFLAGDMIDRMRSNPYGIDQNAYDAIDTDTLVADPKCGASALCTPAEQARQDMYDWREYFRPADGGADTLLPGSGESSPKGTTTDLGNGRFEITVTWYEVVDGEDEEQTLSVFFVAEEV